MSGVLDGTPITVEECCGEEEFLRLEDDIIETAEERDTFTSYQELEHRLSNILEQLDWDRDREDDDDTQKADFFWFSTLYFVSIL